MSGVIIDGTQWERCNQCAGWERIEKLAYAVPNPALPYPQWADPENPKCCDMCEKCMAGVPWNGRYRDPLLNGG